MTFKPTTRDLETIAIMGRARAPADKIVVALGIGEAEFRAWTGRLAAARALMPMSVARATKETESVSFVEAPARPRITADRVFEAASEGDDPIAG
jgi:hypothetical protein